MATIVTRAGKGSPLTNTELDSNFTNLNTDKLELSGGTLTGNLSQGDGVSANFGASNDLTITHTGSSSILKENGTGTFYIQGTDIVFTNSAGSERYADFTDNGAVRLYHDNVAKIATTSSGISVTGSVVADGLTVDTGSTFAVSATLGHTGGSQLFFLSDDGGSRNQIDSQKNSASADLDLATGGVKRQKIASNGDKNGRESCRKREEMEERACVNI